MTAWRHPRDQRGVVFPSPVVILSVVAVAMAGIAFVATRDSAADRAARSPRSPSPRRRPRPRPPRRPTSRRSRSQAEGRARRRSTSWSTTTPASPGLAGRVAAQAGQIGWQVVGSDNWYGTIPATTVYYPPRLKRAGQAARARPRHPAHRARGRPDAARPADRDPHRPSGLAPARHHADVVGWPHGVHLGARASRSTPPWCGRPPSRRRAGLRRHPRADRRRPEPRRTSTPTPATVLADLAEQVLAVAVITGRPARQALDLGGLEEVGNAIGDAGKELYLFGQYGNERWSSTQRRIIAPRPPRGLASFTARAAPAAAPARRRGRLGRGEGARGRRPHPPAGRRRTRAFEGCSRPRAELAARYDLVVEPGQAA